MEKVKLYETSLLLPHCFLSLSLYYLSPLRDSPYTSHFSQNTSFSEQACSFFCMLFDHIRRQACRRKMTSSLTDSETIRKRFNICLNKSIQAIGYPSPKQKPKNSALVLYNIQFNIYAKALKIVICTKSITVDDVKLYNS